MKKVLLPLSFLALLTSCSFQKRLYTAGFYFTGQKKKSDASQLSQQNFNFPKVTLSLKSDSLKPPQLTASLKASPLFAHSGTGTFLEDCDTLILRNGTLLKVKVLEVNETEVKYKYCYTPDDPLVKTPKKEIAEIRYAGGLKEIFPDPGIKQPKEPMRDEEKEIRHLTRASILWGILGCLLPGIGIAFSIMAITRANRAYDRMDFYPKLREKYHRKAKTGTILGVIPIYIFLLAVLAVISYFAGKHH